MATTNQLTLEIDGQSWAVKDGDILGRFSSVAGEVLKNFDVLSRQHLRVEHLQGAWHLTLLPNVRNTTWLDGRMMHAGQPLPLGAINDITVDTVHLRLRQTHQEEATVTDTLVNHPIALVTIDSMLVLQKCNSHALALLDKNLKPGNDFASYFQGHSMVQLRLALDKLSPHQSTPQLELELLSAPSQPARWLSARFALEGHSYLGALQEITNEVSNRTITHSSESKFVERTDTLVNLLSSAPFREGDLPASLPLVAQRATDLLDQCVVTIWLKSDGSHLQLAACGGLTDITQIAHETDLPMPSGDVDDATLTAFKAAHIIPVSTRHAHVHHHDEGVMIFALERDANWIVEEEKLIRLLATLFDQALANSQRAAIMQRLQAREESFRIELNQASLYVSRLLPAPITQGPIQIDWKYQPCGGLGGDVFGYEPLNDDHYALYVMDVAGHGIGAALLAVSIINTLRIWIERKEPWLTDPSAWLFHFNEAFPMEKHGNLTWTAWCGIYQRSKRELSYSSGGHPPSILLDKGHVYELTTKGPVLGALQNIKFETAKTKVSAGAKLYLYTDGVYEFPHANGETGTGSAFTQTVAGTATLGSGECAYLYQHAAALCGTDEFPDDFTLLRVRF